MNAAKTESAFRLRYAVNVTIAAEPKRIWDKLTDASGFPRWNSTVESIVGPIALGSRLKITVPIAPERTFTPKVVEFLPEQRMVWRDGLFPMFQGTRTYSLTPRDGATDFEMVEVFRGAMLPLIKKSLPDFVPMFDRYAADLKRACEVT